VLGTTLYALLGIEEQEEEMRFEVTVRRLPPREGQPQGASQEPYEEKVKRVFGKDKVPSKRAASAARKRGPKA